MQHFLLEPEVAGGLGPRTVMDRSIHPPRVDQLHYEFDGWLGDCIVESFPVFLVTEVARDALMAACVTGAVFAAAEVTRSKAYDDLHPDRPPPPFVWLKPVGRPGQADVGTAEDGRLVVSQAAMDVLRQMGLDSALVADWPEAG